MQDTDDPGTQRARAYLASLQGSEYIQDALYWALLDHGTAPEVKAVRLLLIFHRDTFNGGLAQSTMNERDELDDILQAVALIGVPEPIRTVIEEAVALYRSLPEPPEDRGDAWQTYRALLDAAEPQWNALTKRYEAATYSERQGSDLGRDMVDVAALAFALRHPAAFAEVIATLPEA